jgi:DNA-binding transcriptional MerR regulator
MPAPSDPSPIAPAHQMSVTEVCRATGLSSRTLRYYEELGLLPDVRRRAGGRRVYSDAELERLRFIGRLKALGLSLAEIQELNAVYAIGHSTQQMLRSLDALLDSHLAEIEERSKSLDRLRSEIGSYREHVRARASELERQEGVK